MTVIVTVSAAALKKFETVQQADCFGSIDTVPYLDKEVSLEAQLTGEEKIRFGNAGKFAGGGGVVVGVVAFPHDGVDFNMVAGNAFEEPLVRLDRDENERFLFSRPESGPSREEESGTQKNRKKAHR
jgi:hypothetical protein